MDKKEELQKIVEDLLPSPVIALAYMEHQVDLLTQLVVDLVAATGATLPADAANRLTLLKSLLAQSSIDFSNITDQLQSYKIPNAVAMKAFIHKIEADYLAAQIREGVFDK